MAPINLSSDPSKEDFKHGMALDEDFKRVQCCYCGRVVSGFNGLQHHLGCGSVVDCQQVPKEVREFYRRRLLSVKEGHVVREQGDFHHTGPSSKMRCSSNGRAEVKSSQYAGGQNGDAQAQKPRLLTELASSGSGGSAFLESCSGKEGTRRPRANGLVINADSIMMKRSIGRFFFENAFDFTGVTSPSFLSMMRAHRRSGLDDCNIPSVAELEGWILEDELNDIENYVNHIRLSWPRTGCSVLLDGWTDHLGRSLINVIVDCPEGPIYLCSADVSPATKGADALRLFIETVLEEVGIQNVIQIVSSTSSGAMEVVSRQLLEKYRSLYWAVSATNCMSLILDKFALVYSIKLTLEKAKSITKFIYSRRSVLTLLRSYLGGRDLVKASKIKVAASFLTLENFLSEQRNIERMFASSEWLDSHWASSVEGKRVASLVDDVSFWAGLVFAVKASIPVVRAMFLINGADEPQMGFIYETMDQIKETISQEFGGKQSQYNQFWTIIDEVWNSILHCPLHAAAYFLNPRLHFTEDFFSDTEVVGGLLIAIVRMADDKHVQDMIAQQVELYAKCSGDFKRGTENNQKDSLSPAAWWLQYGNHCPELQRGATRLLSQTCNGADSYGLKKDMAEKLLRYNRGYVPEQLQKLTYVHYNLKLKHAKMTKFNIMAAEFGPSYDDDWVIDELYDGEATGTGNGLPAQVYRHGVGTGSSNRTSVAGEPSSIPPKVESMSEI